MKKILCMDVSGENVRVAEVMKDDIQNCASFSLGFELGVELPEEKNITEFKKNYNSNVKDIVIFMHTSIHRNIEVPILEKSDLIDYIKLNSSDFFPISIEEYIIYAKVTGQNKRTMMVSVLLVPEITIEKSYKTMKMLGFKNIQFSFYFNLPAMENTYLSISSLKNELTYQYFEENQLMYTRSEIVTEMEFSGSVVRFDDYLSSQFSQTLYNLPFALYADDEKTKILTEILDENFNIKYEKSNNEYDYLKNIALNIKKGKYNEHSVDMVLTPEQARKNKQTNFLVAINTGLVILFVLTIGYFIPNSNLTKMENTYYDLIIKDEILSSNIDTFTSMSEAELVSVMDTPNNHFFTLLDELYEKMPSDLIIKSININTSDIQIGVELDTLENCCVALEQMDNLIYARAGDVSSITEEAEKYSFSIMLTYTSAISG